MAKKLLLVDPDGAFLSKLRQSPALTGRVDECTDFARARGRLLANPYDLLVTNLRLQEYNGLHLVYLAQTRQSCPRSVVYTEAREPAFAREVQESGAFYEIRGRLTEALPAYVGATLPERDRRNPAAFDRRRQFRGGRRSSDMSVATI